jgi:hypothetical protein
MTKRILFDGKSSHFAIYAKQKFDYNDSANIDQAAIDVCNEIFSGPCPDVGWWVPVFEPKSRARHWRPKAIISVTGGTEILDSNDEISLKISHEILKTAKTMKALIVDSGSAFGIMAAVSEAFQKDGDQIATLGIIPWNAVAGKDAIEGKTVYRGNADTKYRKNEINLDRNHTFFALIETECPGSEIQNKDADIDKAAETRGEKGSDIVWWNSELRARFHIEKVLSQRNSDTESPFPHIMIVVNGGFDTIDTVHMFCTGRYNTLHDKNDIVKDRNAVQKKIPVVIVAGSGRAADLIVSVLNEKSIQPQKREHNIAGDDCKQQWKPGTNLRAFFDRHGLNTDGEQDDSLHEYALKIMEICTEREFITIYCDHDKSSLTSCVMKAVSKKECGENLGKKLKLMLEWNNPEGLELMKEVLTNVKLESKSEKMVLSEGLRIALQKNLVKFVVLFYDYDIEADAKVLEDIYLLNKEDEKSCSKQHHDCINCQPIQYEESMLSLAKRLMDHMFGFKSSTIQGVNRECKSSTVASRNIRSIVNWMCSVFSRNRIESMNIVGKENFETSGSGATKSSYDTRNTEGNLKRTGVKAAKPTRDDMLLWSILSGRHELAWFFWQVSGRSRRQHSISRALLASAILKASVLYIPKQFRKVILGGRERPCKDQSESWSRFALKFEQAATDILDLCYKKDPEMAISIITIPWIHHKDWFLVNSSRSNQLLNPFQLAFAAKAKSFVAHPAFQECLDRIWFARIQMTCISSVNSEDPSQERDVPRPTGYRIKHHGLLRWISWTGELRRQMMQVNIFLSSLLVFPVIISEIKIDRSDNALVPGYQSHVYNLYLKFIGFYSAPCVKFYLDFLSYFTFLILFTFVGFRLSYAYTFLEGIVHAWIIAMILREIRDYWFDGRSHLLFSNNYFDILMLLFYLPAAFLRIYERCMYTETEFNSVGGFRNEPLGNGTLAWYEGIGEDWGKARSWHGIAGIFFWVRIVDYFRASHRLGPLMLVLAKVTRDSLQFFLVLIVFIISFGAAIICAGRPRDDPSVSISTYFKKAIFVPLLGIFGEHFLDSNSLSISNHPMCAGDSLAESVTCSQQQSLGITLYCIYLFISSIILMNLLIASEYFSDMTLH